MQIAPSLLAANFLDLRAEITALENANADFLHIDVMDGHFVPNLTFGPVVLQNLKNITKIPLDVHLMVQNTPFFIDLFAPLSPKIISVHVENEPHLNRIIHSIKNRGFLAGAVLNPHTDPEILRYVINDLDLVLCMSVNPGFGGQKFLPIFEKITALKNLIMQKNPACKIQVDGGVSDQNIAALARAGADICVVGSYLFAQNDYKKTIENLKNLTRL